MKTYQIILIVFFIIIICSSIASISIKKNDNKTTIYKIKPDIVKDSSIKVILDKKNNNTETKSHSDSKSISIRDSKSISKSNPHSDTNINPFINTIPNKKNLYKSDPYPDPDSYPDPDPDPDVHIQPDLNAEHESIPVPDFDSELEMHLMKKLNLENGKSVYTNKIKQFKIKQCECKVSSTYINNMKIYNMTFPVRVREPFDIIGAVHFHESYNHINTMKELISIGKSMSNGLVVQEILPGNEYIISCFDGTVDILYELKNNKVLTISLKNICLENKKFMREIIKKQHSKIGTVKGIFEIGFISSHPTVPFINDPLFKFVGINVAVNGTREKYYNINDTISYPYNEEKL